LPRAATVLRYQPSLAGTLRQSKNRPAHPAAKFSMRLLVIEHGTVSLAAT
jgi:hypothetical protein